MTTSISVRLAQALATLTAALAPSAAAGEVWILEEPPVGPFATIQQAVNAAPEGALLLVQTATYDESPLVDGKSLSLVGPPGTFQPSVRRTLRVRNLAAGQRVIVRGLDVSLWTTNPNSYAVGPAVRLENNQGLVRLEDCHLDGGRTGTSWPWSGAPALDVQACTHVIVKDCLLHAGQPGYCAGCEPSEGGDGLRSFQSAVALFGCELLGGMGSNETSPSGGHAGHGARVEGYGLVAAGCTMRGGEGGGADYVACEPGGDGGDGLRIVGAQAKLLDTTLSGGAGGWSICDLTGDPGQPIHATSSSVEQLVGPSRSLSVASLAQDGTLVAVQVSGVPGDRVALFVADEPGFEYEPALNGLWAIEPVPARALVAEGIVPASGVLDLQLKAPVLGPGEAHRLLFLQGLCLSTSGESFLTSPAHLWVHGPPLP